MKEDESNPDSPSNLIDLDKQSEPTLKSTLHFPNQLNLIPLTRRPFFPGMLIPLLIEPGSFYESLKRIVKEKNKILGLVLTKKENINLQKITIKDLYSVGVAARILRINPMEGGYAQITLNIEKRFKILRAVPKTKYLQARVSYHSDNVRRNRSKVLKAYIVNVISMLKELLKLNPLFKEELQAFLHHSDFTEPGKLADFSVSLTTASRDDLQKILATFNLESRIKKTLALLKKELDLAKLQNTIYHQLETTAVKMSNQALLQEQLKIIKKKLGIDKEDKSSDVEKFQKRLNSRTVPTEVMNVIGEELDKLKTLEMQSAEYSVCRNYLEWLTIIPWGILSPEKYNLTHSAKILEQDHYGLKDIKSRMLEFISVGKLSGGMKGSIICLVGPPGVGKTSIGKSIAKAINRKFYRFSVGGMRDEAEIKGHRRTYVGSMPGKIVQALKFTQTMNPIIMLDEVDKLGSNFQGDPASALLEVLDPEQNKDFLDHYLDVRCDLSHILFLVTSNVLDTIPGPLRDRMDILRLSGYVKEEKLHIAKRYLIPRNRQAMSLQPNQVHFTSTALNHMIEGYAREAGVRSLEKHIQRILRKVAYKIIHFQESNQPSKKNPVQVENLSLPIHITPKDLSDYLGPPVFTSDRIYPKTPPGVCIGLAWTALGGAILYVESIRIPSDKCVMRLTGQVGSVMKESAQIAWSYLHSKAKEFAPGKKFFPNQEVHLHIPEGATPKDGPSAGVTMVTAMLSLLINRSVRKDVGMTGELTLTGKVLPVGGIKEKLIAAKREKLKILILPKENERDLHELASTLKKSFKLYFVSDYIEIYSIIFSKRRKT